MDPDDEDLLVVGAVEDADVAALRELLLVAPQVVVVEILARRDLEAADLDALWVDPAHDVADGAVLAGRVHRLEDHHDAVGVLGGKTRLVVGEEPDAEAKDLLRLLDADLAGTGRVEVVGQADASSRFDPEWLDEARDPLDSRVGHVGVLSVGVDPSLVVERSGVATVNGTLRPWFPLRSAVSQRGSRSLRTERIGWRARIRTWNPLIQSQVPYR